MLEKLGVGQRSEVRPFVVLVLSQKKAKVRCSRVSRNAPAPVVSGGGGPTEWLDAQAAAAKARTAMKGARLMA